MENSKLNKKMYIIFSIVIFIISVLLVSKVMQNDTFFTIRIGNDVFENGLTRVDNLTIHENISFIHLRWLFDALIAFLYNLFGFNGIYFFTSIFTGIIGLTLFNTLVKRKHDITLSFIFTLVVMIMTSSSFTARAQLISYPIFILEIYLIEKVIKEGKRRDMVFLSILPLILANFHASVLPMYFILFMPYIAEAFVFNIKYRLKKYKSDKKEAFQLGKIEVENIDIKRLLIVMLVGFMLGLISPAFIDGYTYMFKCALGSSNSVINELQPITIKSAVFPFIMILILISLLLVKNTKIRLSDLCMFLGLGMMGFLAFRNLPFFYFVIPVCFLRIVFSSNNITKVINVAKGWLYNSKILREYFAIFLTVASFLVISSSLLLERSREEYIEKTSYPIEATKYIKENIDIESMRLYNHLNFGSYLELNEIPVFIDSRTEIYTPEFNPNAILVEWDLVKNGKHHYKELFEKYNITHVLLYQRELLNIYIKDNDEYEEIYSDGAFALYKRKI